MPNNLKRVDPALRQAITAAWPQVIAQHGEDPGTRAQAAAHEAGHIVVAAVLGERIVSARVDRRKCRGRAVWVGNTERAGGPVIGRYTDVRAEPVNGLHMAASELAGYAGECAVGLGHPSSSIDERAKAQQICETVDKTLAMRDGESGAGVMGFCQEAIRANRSQFDLIRAALMRATKLHGGEARRHLEGLTRIDVPWSATLETRTPA